MGFQFSVFLSFFMGESTLPRAGWSQQSYCNAGFVQTSDFTFFTDELLGDGWSQQSCCNAGFVQTSDFTLFMGDNLFLELADLSNLVEILDQSKLQILLFLWVIIFSRSWLISVILLRYWISPNFRFYFFLLGDNFFPCCNAGVVQTEDSPSNFSITCQPFLVWRFCQSTSWLFLIHHLAESHHPIDLDFFRFNRLKCKGYR